MATVGFLGLGKMGCGMARRLLDAGHELAVYNRSEGKAVELQAAGARVAKTAADAARGADAVVAMVADDAASKEVWLGPQGALAGLSPGALAVECSTLSSAWVHQLAAVVESQGLDYLDSPVTGMPDAAAAGALTLFLGGSHGVIARAQPVLQPLCTEQIHFGAIGAGTSYKLIVNLMGSVQIVATAEAMALAEKSGLDPAQVSDALSRGAAASANVIRCSGQMVRANYREDVPFSAGLRLKDTRYGLALAAQSGQQMLLGELAGQAFQQTVDGGFAEQSESKVLDLVRSVET